MGKYKSAVKALADTYEYFDDGFLKRIHESMSIALSIDASTYQCNDIDNGMDQLIYCWLIMMYGDYGTSPRGGWITDIKGALKWLDEFMEGWKWQ